MGNDVTMVRGFTFERTIDEELNVLSLMVALTDVIVGRTVLVWRATLRVCKWTI